VDFNFNHNHELDIHHNIVQLVNHHHDSISAVWGKR